MKWWLAVDNGIHRVKNNGIHWVKKVVRNEEGVTAIEYGLLAALIAVVIIVAVAAVGTALSGTFNHVATHITTP